MSQALDDLGQIIRIAAFIEREIDELPRNMLLEFMKETQRKSQEVAIYLSLLEDITKMQVLDAFLSFTPTEVRGSGSYHASRS